MGGYSIMTPTPYRVRPLIVSDPVSCPRECAKNAKIAKIAKRGAKLRAVGLIFPARWLGKMLGTTGSASFTEGGCKARRHGRNYPEGILPFVPKAWSPVRSAESLRLSPP